METKLITQVWTIVASKPLPDGTLWSEMRRPQDWGDPKWTHRVFAYVKDEYSQGVHCWVDVPMSETEMIELFRPLITQVFIPGTPVWLCGAEFMDEDDFWDEKWGDMPPFYPDGDEHDEGW